MKGLPLLLFLFIFLDIIYLTPCYTYHPLLFCLLILSICTVNIVILKQNLHLVFVTFACNSSSKSRCFYSCLLHSNLKSNQRASKIQERSCQVSAHNLCGGFSTYLENSSSPYNAPSKPCRIWFSMPSDLVSYYSRFVYTFPAVLVFYFAKHFTFILTLESSYGLWHQNVALFS